MATIATPVQKKTWDSIDRAYTTFQGQMDDAETMPLTGKTDGQLKDLRAKIERSLHLLQRTKAEAPQNTVQTVTVGLKTELVDSNAHALLGRIDKILSERSPQKLKAEMAKTDSCWDLATGQPLNSMGRPAFVFKV